MEPINVPESQNLEEQDNNVSTRTSRGIRSLYAGFLIGIAFLIVFFTLNYLNILSLSTLFPNELGWLPHKEKAATSNYKPKKTFPQNQSVATSSGYIRFSYDTTKAEKILKDYITDSIKEAFLPSKIEVKQNLLSTGELKGTDYKFGANWTSNDIVFNAGLHYINNTNDLRDTEIYIIPKGVKNTPVDLNNSSALVKTYFNNIPESIDFHCGVFKETTKFCEHFTVSDAGKSGLGIVQSKDKSDNSVLLIFSCFVPKNDSYYNKRTSCLLFREKDPTGL